MSSADRTLLVDDVDRVRVLRINRPDVLNAFDPALFDALTVALRRAEHDTSVGCVVLTAEGRAFSAGWDLEADDPPDDGEPHGYEPFMERLESFGKPLIAAVNGAAIGIGMTLLGHADLVMAASSARFRAPFTGLGLVPEAGSTATLPARMGSQAAAYALLSSAWIDAESAHTMGFVWRVVPDDELETAVLDTASEIAQHPVNALVATKRLLLASRLPAARAARRLEDVEFRRAMEGPDFAAALAAFRSGEGSTER